LSNRAATIPYFIIAPVCHCQRMIVTPCDKDGT